MEYITLMRHLRLQKKMSMVQMSVSTGLGLSALYNYENGYREPSVTRAEKIADVLDYEGKLSNLFMVTFIETPIKEG